MEALNTLSICNKCYKKIPAVIFFLNGKVGIEKSCCDELQTEMIEKDVNFFWGMRSMSYNNVLGDICNIAITDDCNTTCKACYCKIQKREKSVGEVVELARTLPTWINKVMLTGGEPTIHSKFFDIVSQLSCGVITNGIAFADFPFLREFAKWNVYVLRTENEIATMFSLNTPDSLDYDKKMVAIDNFRKAGLKIAMVSATIMDLNEVPIVLSEFQKIKDVVTTFKIRSAFNIGESSGFKHIYLSELMDEVQKHSNLFRLVSGMHNNTYLINAKCDGLHLMLVKCPDKTIVDLCNISPTGPYQLTHLNTFEDVMVALIINEGIEKGWFEGRRIQ